MEIDGIEYYSCLCNENFKDGSIHDSMWLYSQYKLGHLGFEGSLTEQPSKYIELMKLMEKLNSEYEHRMNSNKE